MLLDKELLFRRTTGKLEGEMKDEALLLYEKYFSKNISVLNTCTGVANI